MDSSNIAATSSGDVMIHLLEKLDFTKLKPSAPFKNRMGGNSVRVYYEDNRRFFFQTPSMPTPFGVSEYVPADNGSSGGASKQSKYSLDLSFRYEDSEPKVQQFRHALECLDNLMISWATENSVSWFGKILSKEVVSELYSPLLRVSSQPDKYKPLMKCKIRERPEDLMATTEHGDKFDMGKYMPGGRVKLILELMPVWFMNRRFGLSASIVRVMVTELPNFQVCRDNGFLSGFSFIKDDDDDRQTIDLPHAWPSTA